MGGHRGIRHGAVAGIHGICGMEGQEECNRRI